MGSNLTKNELSQISNAPYSFYCYERKLFTFVRVESTDILEDLHLGVVKARGASDVHVVG